MKEKSIVQQIQSFFKKHIKSYQESKNQCRKLSLENEAVQEYQDNFKNALGNILILLVIFGVIAIIFYFVLQGIISVVNFLAQPKLIALHIIAIFTAIMIPIALILSSLQKKPEKKEDTPKQVHLKSVNYRSALFDNLCVTASSLGLKTPLHESELSSRGREPYFEIGTVKIFQFLVWKTPNAEKPVNLKDIKETVETKFSQMESNYEVATSDPEGYPYNGDLFNSILVMKVLDRGEFVEIGLAQASDESCALYVKGEHFKDDNTNDDDKEF